MNMNLVGVSGTSYEFHESRIEEEWEDVPAIYAFAYLGIGGWKLLYVGQCDSARKRIPSHERWAEAKKRSATRVLNHLASTNEEVRLQEERDLIEAYKPEMNAQNVGHVLLTETNPFKVAV